MVALGIGGSHLFVAELGYDTATGTFHVVEDYPDPAVSLPWDLPGFPGVAEPEASLLSLAPALQAAGVTTAAPPRPSQAHDVRLSTRNLRVEGIDLDFEVTRGGERRGTLSVSRGGLLWRPARTHRRKGAAKAGIRISWAEFEAWAES